MPRKAKAITYVDELFISEENYNRILAWGQSENEINIICFGNGKVIENVTRLRNISRVPKNYCLDSKIERKALIKEKKNSGQVVLASGHSHPSRHHDQHPSKADVKYIKEGTIELIVFPHRKYVQAWKIRTTVEDTLKSEVKLSFL